MVMGRWGFVSFRYPVLMVLVMYCLRNYVVGSAPAQSVSCSEIMHLPDTIRIASIEVDEPYLRGRLKTSVRKKSPYIVSARGVAR